MNREILFRGKRVDNGKWFEGDGIQYPKSIKRKGECWVGGVKGINDWVQVIPETVGQYTGIDDENGVKIFEGDVVKCYASEDAANCVVIFEKGEYRLVPTKRYKDYQECCGYHAIRCFVKIVIGNIHDNPELLGTEE